MVLRSAWRLNLSRYPGFSQDEKAPEGNSPADCYLFKQIVV
ncbi:hypothetical protein BD65_1596 [Yersinia ruckeri]|nr:hypothetical protein BD65_1596 [Yersinia ruckeri]